MSRRIRWWTREPARQLLSIPPALAGGFVSADTSVMIIASWDIFAIVYLAQTWAAFRGRELVAVDAMLRFGERRWFGTISRPEQLSQAAAIVALIAAVIAMPKAGEPGTPAELVLPLSIAAVISSWLILQAGFAMTYLSLHVRGGGLEFPGDEPPGLGDFAYFALAVGTTFGTTDVTVTRRAVRRQVLAHGALAFFFNTLIVAFAITGLGQWVGR